MRRISGLANLSRAIAGEFSGATSRHRVKPVTFNSPLRLFSTDRSSEEGVTRSSFSHSLNHGLCRTMSFSTATAKVSQSSVKFQPKEVVLYQYEACPFCNKVKAFLDFSNIPYKVVEVNPINKKEIKWSDYKKVPILKIDGESMVDSTAIIDNLFEKINPANPAMGTEEELKWRKWVDNHLVHVLSPNIYRTPSEAIESFDYITTHGNFSLAERMIAKYGGAAAMYFVAKKLKKRHNITDERKALYEAAETWVDALEGRHFLELNLRKPNIIEKRVTIWRKSAKLINDGGSGPNLADISAFGVLRPIRHLQSGRDMVDNTRIGDWYTRMDNAVGESCRIHK